MRGEDQLRIRKRSTVEDIVKSIAYYKICGEVTRIVAIKEQTNTSKYIRKLSLWDNKSICEIKYGTVYEIHVSAYNGNCFALKSNKPFEKGIIV